MPIDLQVLVERVLDHDGYILPAPGGVRLVAAGGEEAWESVTFPLLLCPECLARFESSSRSLKNGLKATARTMFWVIGALATFIPFIGAIVWAARLGQTRHVDPFILPWLQKIPWVSEVIAQEQEYRIGVGMSHAFVPTRQRSKHGPEKAMSARTGESSPNIRRVLCLKCNQRFLTADTEQCPLCGADWIRLPPREPV